MLVLHRSHVVAGLIFQTITKPLSDVQWVIVEHILMALHPFAVV